MMEAPRMAALPLRLAATGARIRRAGTTMAPIRRRLPRMVAIPRKCWVGCGQGKNNTQRKKHSFHR